MTKNARPVKFIEHLPDFMREDNEILPAFLKPFEDIFEELQISIEGNVYYTELLSIENDETILVKSFEYTKNSLAGDKIIAVPDKEIEAPVYSMTLPNKAGNPLKIVTGKKFISMLNEGDRISIFTGRGLSDVFDPNHDDLVLNQKNIETSEYRQFKYSPANSEYQRLKFLASWVGIPLRDDKDFEWNRRFFKNVIPIWDQRCTVEGFQKILTEWLKGDLEEKEGCKPLIVTDLTRRFNRTDAVFCLNPAEPNVLGVNTILGEGPPNFFIVDLILNSDSKELYSQNKIVELHRAVKFLIDSEKPANTYYELRIRAHTMRLAKDTGKPGELDLQIGETSLIWDGASVYRGE